MTVQVFVVDDSAVVRQTMQHILEGDAEFRLAGTAPNPLLALPLLRKSRPDVLLLDIEMPGMDGLTFLRQLMAEGRPIPTVICSTLTSQGSDMALEALAAGAVAVVGKPRLGLKNFLEDSRRELLRTLKTAARSRPRGASGPTPGASAVAVEAATVPVGPRPVPGRRTLAVNKPVLIGSSTGGAQAIETILCGLPSDCPGIAIVQHMPEKFTAQYAQRLDRTCSMSVREAKDGDRLERGLVLIAPGGLHMQLRKSHGQYFVSVLNGPPVNRHKPSVDVLFRSAAECAGSDALAIMLTGMGDDGARAMMQLHRAGASTVAQDEATCVVFGMPMEAIKLGAVDKVLPLGAIAAEILRFDARG